MRNYLSLAAILALVLSPVRLSAQTAPPTISAGGILSAAALAADPGNVAAPGSLITILGQNLSSSAASGTGSPLPRTLNSTAVQVGNEFAPLLFVSPTQINAQIPLDIPADTFVDVIVWNSGSASVPQQIRVNAAAPAVFTLTQNGVGNVVAFHGDGSLVSGSSPAVPGEGVSLLMTGLGATLASSTSPPLATGENGNGQPTLLVPAVTIDAKIAPVSSSVAAPGRVGQYLVRVLVPSDAPVGDDALGVSAGGKTTGAPLSIPVALAGSGGTGGGGGGGGPVAIFPGGIVNGASLAPAPNNQSSPGALISIFGNNLATGVGVANNAPQPLDINGTSVLIGSIPAPLLLVSPGQINAQVPFEIQPNSTVNVVVVVNGRASSPEPLRVVSAAPGVFSAAGNGAGPARVFHPNGTAVTNSSPAIPGEQVSFFVTGLGLTLTSSNLPALKTGEAGSGQPTLFVPTVTIGAKTAIVTLSVAAPGLVGQDLVKLIVPDVPAGDQSVVFTAGGNASRGAVFLRVGFQFPQPPAFLRAIIAGDFTASFGLNVKVPDPTDATKEVDEIASFTKTITSQQCRIDIAGSNGPTYEALVHCQDYSDPTNLFAIIMGLKDGQFADNKLVFTTILDSAINHFFYIGTGRTGPATDRAVTLTAEAPITAGAVSIDFKKPDFVPGNPLKVIGTLHVTLKLAGSGTIPGQTVTVGGGFSDDIIFVQR